MILGLFRGYLRSAGGREGGLSALRWLFGVRGASGAGTGRRVEGQGEREMEERRGKGHEENERMTR